MVWLSHLHMTIGKNQSFDYTDFNILYDNFMFPSFPIDYEILKNEK